jgi:hypothetical protein
MNTPMPALSTFIRNNRLTLSKWKQHPSVASVPDAVAVLDGLGTQGLPDVVDFKAHPELKPILSRVYEILTEMVTRAAPDDGHLHRDDDVVDGNTDAFFAGVTTDISDAIIADMYRVTGQGGASAATTSNGIPMMEAERSSITEECMLKRMETVTGCKPVPPLRTRTHGAGDDDATVAQERPVGRGKEVTRKKHK